MNTTKVPSEIQVTIEPGKEISLEHESFKNWDFFWNVEKMLSSKELDMIAEKVKINRLPDMLFGYNRFYLVYQPANFVLEINPLHMLDLACYNERKSNLVEVNEKEKEASLKNLSEDSLNFIYYRPCDVKVQYYNKWKDVKVEREDIQKIDPVADWTFSSSYMGTIGKLNDHKLYSFNPKFFSNFDSNKIYKQTEIKHTSDTLPVHRLGQDNPIVKYMEVHLYDDELCDNGLSQGNFRYI